VGGEWVNGVHAPGCAAASVGASASMGDTTRAP